MFDDGDCPVPIPFNLENPSRTLGGPIHGLANSGLKSLGRGSAEIYRTSGAPMFFGQKHMQ